MAESRHGVCRSTVSADPWCAAIRQQYHPDGSGVVCRFEGVWSREALDPRRRVGGRWGRWNRLRSL